MYMEPILTPIDNLTQPAGSSQFMKSYNTYNQGQSVVEHHVVSVGDPAVASDASFFYNKHESKTLADRFQDRLEVVNHPSSSERPVDPAQSRCRSSENLPGAKAQSRQHRTQQLKMGQFHTF